MQGRRILVTSYGGAHIKILLPVIEVLEQRGAHVDILALTTACRILQDLGRSYWTVTDFVDKEQDTQALDYGRELAEKYHDPRIGISLEESIAYLGLSWSEVIADYGLEKAQELFAEHGRQCFLPKRLLRRVFDRLKPDLCLTTNSPRAEWAATIVARERKIPAIRVSDLLGNQYGDSVMADVICLSCDPAKELITEVANYEPGADLVVTGSPQFDWLLPWIENPAKQVEALAWQKKMGIEKPLVLFALASYLTDYERDAMNAIGAWMKKHPNVQVGVRAHPNSGLKFHGAYLEQAFGGSPYLDLSQEPLGPVLASTHLLVNECSTLSIEAGLLGKKVVTLRAPDDAAHLLPISRYGWSVDAWGVEGIMAALDSALHEPWDKEKQNKIRRAFHLDGKAASRIVDQLDRVKDRYQKTPAGQTQMIAARGVAGELT